MKKIIHKLKKNRLVSKIAALLTICMILVSSFTISSFAADEEEFTNSITDVWTGVTDSIMSLFGIAQGVFFTESGSSNSVVLDSADLLEVTNGNLTKYIVPLPDFDASSAVLGDSYDFSFLGQTYSLTFGSDTHGVFFGSPTFLIVSYFSIPSGFEFLDTGVWYLVIDEPFSGTATLTIPFSFGGNVSLSFLGTLAAVAVAIALIMLLVYVISRFLRLRG